MDIERLTDISRRAEAVLNEIELHPVPAAEFFDLGNIWKKEVWGTGLAIIEFYRSILLLTEQNLLRPAMALSRSVDEAYCRLEYLSDREDELRDWFEWLCSHEYHQLCEHLLHDTGLNPAADQDAREAVDDIESLMGATPPKRKYPWRRNAEILETIAGRFTDEFHQRIHRRILQEPSEFIPHRFRKR